MTADLDERNEGIRADRLKAERHRSERVTWEYRAPVIEKHIRSSKDTAQYLWLHKLPLGMLTGDEELLAVYGADARFDAVLCRDDRVILLENLRTAGGEMIRAVSLLEKKAPFYRCVENPDDHARALDAVIGSLRQTEKAGASGADIAGYTAADTMAHTAAHTAAHTGAAQSGSAGVLFLQEWNVKRHKLV